MAESAPAATNKAVVFRGRKESVMPVKSKAQNAAMHAAAEGKSTLGIPKKVGTEFTKDQAPGSVKKLPQRAGNPSSKAKALAARGLISEKQEAGIEAKRSYGGKDDGKGNLSGPG